MLIRSTPVSMDNRRFDMPLAATILLDITAALPDGASEHTIRTVTENAHTLKFGNHDFEKE
ncbi:MAG: hypothetical protein GX130_14050 [Candidatus Hydrogenedens sp.]|nr:hypothetical protein [Candidatus Hydrogenedens sp.]